MFGAVRILTKLNTLLPPDDDKNHHIILHVGDTFPTLYFWIDGTGHQWDCDTEQELCDSDGIIAELEQYIATVRDNKT